MKVIQALLVLTMSLRSNAVGIETVGTVKDCVEGSIAVVCLSIY